MRAACDGGLTADEQAMLDEWTQADVRHAGAYARALAADSYLDRLRALGQDYVPPPPAPAINRRWLLGGAGGAIAASAIGLVAVRWMTAPTTYAAGKGGLERVALQDGSSITLNTASQVSVDLARHARRLVLLDGEAIFDVAHDPSRPFTVAVGDLAVRAVGTSFIVRRLDGGGALVTVREGVVALLRDGAETGRLAAFEQAMIGPGASPPIRLSSADLDRAEAWQQGRLVFADTPLATAAQEFARYSNYRIDIADPAAGRRTIAGAYATADARGFAEAAALSLGLHADFGPDRVRLSSSPNT